MSQDETLRTEAERLLRELDRCHIGGDWQCEISDHLYGYYTVTTRASNRRLAECWNGAGPFIGAAPRLVRRFMAEHDKKDAHIAALLAQVQTLQQGQAWQPIASAPKDGTRILVIDDVRRWAWVSFWRPPAYAFGGDCFHHLAGCWVMTGPECGNQPTHWMPLPKGPTA